MASQASCSTDEKTSKEAPLCYFEGSPPSTFGVHKSQPMTFDTLRVSGLESVPMRTLLTNRFINNRVLVLSEREFCSDSFIGNHCAGRGYGALCGFFVGTRISVINIDEGRIAELGTKPYYAILMVPSQTDLEAMKQYVGVEANRAKLSDSQRIRVNNALLRVAYEGRERGAPEYVSCVYNTLKTMYTNNMYTPSRQRRYWKDSTNRRSVYARSMFMLLCDVARLRALLPHLCMLGLSADSLLMLVKGAEKM